MELAEVIALVQRVESTDPTRCHRDDVTAALGAVQRLRSWTDANEARLGSALASTSSFPEMAVGEATRGGLRHGMGVIERAEAVDAMPVFGELLRGGELTARHVDAAGAGLRSLEPKLRPQFLAIADRLANAARDTSPEDFSKAVRREVRFIEADDGMARFERQRRNTRLRTWVDQSGMWRLNGQFDPVAGATLASRLRATVDALFSAATPDTCPSDPCEKNDHLRALALVALTEGRGPSRSGKPEVVVVVDATVPRLVAGPSPAEVVGHAGAQRRVVAPRGAGGGPNAELAPVLPDRARHEEDDGSPRVAHRARVGAAARDERAGATAELAIAERPLSVDWGIPVEVPTRVLLDLVQGEAADVQTVVVGGGIVLFAPGVLDLGRSTRIASAAQRRALRALYRGCAVPGCRVHFNHCKIHHITWWRHGGRTDLANLLPLCVQHHHRVHDDGWIVELGPNDRSLAVQLPDGTRLTTGPPRRSAA